MIKLLDTGKTKAVGVSNFSPAMVDAITEATGVKPVVNQIERHPRLLQKDLLKHHKEKNIVVTAYSGQSLGFCKIGFGFASDFS